MIEFFLKKRKNSLKPKHAKGTEPIFEKKSEIIPESILKPIWTNSKKHKKLKTEL